MLCDIISLMSALKSKKEKQINLLPQDKFSETTAGRVLVWFLSTFRTLVIIVELFVISAFMSRFWLDAKNTDLSEEIRQKEAQIKAMKETENRIREVQKKTSIISEVSSNKIIPSEVISKLTSQIPPTIILSSIALNEEKITISGIAKDENSIAQILVNLQSQEEFKNTALSQIGPDEENSQLLKFSLSIPVKKTEN